MNVEWETDRFGTVSAKLGRRLELLVAYEGLERVPYDEPHYNVYVFGARLKVRSPDVDHGKARAEKLAREWLTAALEKLGTPVYAGRER